MIRIANASKFRTTEMRKLVALVERHFKKSFVFTPLTQITVATDTYGDSWSGRYAGDGHISMRIGRNLKFPAMWHVARKGEDIRLPTWEDWFVAMVSWCLMLHIQACRHSKRVRAGEKPDRKYRRADAEEMCARFLKRWRVDSNLDLIKEKVNLDEI